VGSQDRGRRERRGVDTGMLRREEGGEIETRRRDEGLRV
jgi:hypothetical protein